LELNARVQEVRETNAADLAEHGSIIIVASVHYARHQRSITRMMRFAKAFTSVAEMKIV
jgi:menaquinone-dependent protoporphyrinogen IX oxidase